MCITVGVKLEQPDVGALKHNAAQFADARQYADTEQVSITVIGNLVTGLPRPASNEIDFAAGARAVNEFVPLDVRQRAADEFLEGMASKLGRPRDEVDAEHASLAAVVTSGEYNVAALRDLLYQFVRG